MSTRQQRERRLLVALGVSVLVLLSAAILVANGQRAASTPVSTGIDANTVSRVDIVRPARADITLERRRGDDWGIVAPCALDAQNARIDPLLGALGAAALDYPAGEVDLEAAGLLEPLAEIRLDGAATLLGGTDLGDERRYALTGNRVALVPEWTLSLVDGGLSALADPVPFPNAPTRLRRLDAGTAAAEPTASSSVDDADPASWEGLAASQIVTWPVPGAPATTRTAGYEATFASGETRRYELVGNESWNALRLEGNGCAWLFADDDLPPGAYP